MFLDIHTEAGRHKEYLKFFLYEKPKNAAEREHNRENERLAKAVRAQMELQLHSSEHGLESGVKRRMNFLEYYQAYVDGYSKRNFRVVIGSLKYFKDFIGKEYIKPNEITEQLCIDYREYLKKHLNGETPANYFTKFKQMLRKATREKVFAVNPAAEVTAVSGEGEETVKKNILNFKEIKALAAAPCGNPEVKRAFLLACYTGLRFCDVVELKWGNINGDILNMIQGKTKKRLTANLSPSARKLLGECGKPEENVFTLPTSNGTNKVLEYWAKRAGLQKHITFHCARHSFATNLVIYETDIHTVSSLLGHASLDHTVKYLRVVESLKEKAVNRLPEIEI